MQNKESKRSKRIGERAENSVPIGFLTGLIAFMMVFTFLFTGMTIVNTQNNVNLGTDHYNFLDQSKIANTGGTYPVSSNNTIYVGEHCYSGLSPNNHTEIYGRIVAYQANNFRFYAECNVLFAQNNSNLESGGADSSNNTLYQSIYSSGYLPSGTNLSLGHPIPASGFVDYGFMHLTAPYILLENHTEGTITCNQSIESVTSSSEENASSLASISVANNVTYSNINIIHGYPQNVQWGLFEDVGGHTIVSFNTVIAIKILPGHIQSISYSAIGNTTYNKQVPNWYGRGTHSQIQLSTYELYGTYIMANDVYS